LPESNGGVEELPGGTPTEREFRLRQVREGKAVTLSLRVFDRCGDWRTVVGGGDAVFRN
jgi:hypothetical protein